MRENFTIPFDISLLQLSELTDSSWNYIDIWKQESSDDVYLMNYFLETPSYNELCKTNKYIVSWRKWTWKTALRRAFIDKKKQDKWSIIEDLNFSHIFSPWFFNWIQNLINENYTQEISKSYIDKITLIIMIRWIVILLKNEDSELSHNDMKILNDILDLNWLIDLSDISTTSLSLKSLKMTSEFLAKYNIQNLVVSYWSQKKSEYWINEVDCEQILPYIQKFIISLLKRTHLKYYLLFDWIDQARVFTSPEIYSKIIQDFLLSVFRINELITQELKNSSRVIVFIRNDILDLLQWNYDDMWKLMWDYRVRIDWQEDYDNTDSLLNQVIEKRIQWWITLRNSNKNYSKPLFKNALNNSKALKSIINNPPNFFSDDNWLFSIHKFLYNRTLLRPRDYIQFFWILSKSKNYEYFDRDYSEYFKLQTLDEIKKIAKNYEKTEKALELTCSWKWEFKGSEFIANYILENKHNTKSLRIEAENTLELLYKYWVIGYIDTNTFWNKRTRFYYRETDTRRFNPETCILHAWLYRAYWVI